MPESPEPAPRTPSSSGRTAAAAAQRLRATAAARAAVARILAVRGQVAFVQQERRAAQGQPRCVLARDLVVVPADRRVGEVDGCPFYVDADLDDVRGRPAYELDVAAGEAREPLRGADPTLHFVVRLAA